MAPILMAMVAVLIAVGFVAWLAQSAPSLVVHDPLQDPDPPLAPTGIDEDDDGENDSFTQNPFELSGSGPLPKVEIPGATLHNFGRMVLGSTGRHDFVIRNTGEAPLKLAKGMVQCKCTVSGLKQDEVPPGEEAVVSLAWTPKTSGPFSQGAEIFTNDPEHPKVMIQVEGEMYPVVITEPASNWVLGTIPQKEEARFNGMIYSQINEDLELTGVESSSDSVNVTFHAMSPEDLESVRALSGFILEGVVAASDKSGRVRENVVVRTNLEDASEFNFSISATRSGPMQIIGPGFANGANKLNLGTVSAEKGLTRRLTVMVVAAEEEMQLEDVQTVPGFIGLKLKRESKAGTSGRERYSLTVTVPPGSPQGVWIGKPAGRIHFKTNHPLVPEIEMEVSMQTR